MFDRRRVVLAVALVATVCASSAHADSSLFGGGSDRVSSFGFSPKVPVSALARPAGWLDPSRLQLSTSFSVGTGFNGGTDAMQVTRLGYQFKAPVWMSVSVGNAFGRSNASKDGSSLFLEGLEFGARPFANLLVQVSYRDFRSPLQIPNDFRGYGWGGY